MKTLQKDLHRINISNSFAQAEDPYTLLMEKLTPIRSSLVEHSVYKALTDVMALRTFMESHIFAVWDFMSLLKTLQKQLTSVDIPWLPPTDSLSARLVNDIVLAEESDEVAPEVYTSHYDLYLAAMEEIGADTLSNKSFIDTLRQGYPPKQALSQLNIPQSTKDFVLFTLETTTKSTHEVAAAFLLGREDIIPAMFGQILSHLESSDVYACDSLRLYLDRHCFLDEEQHSPMGRKLLKNLCGNDPLKWEQAFNSACDALKYRHSLWNDVARSIQKRRKSEEQKSGVS
jgi:Protein of unknown function (DUF3050)